MNFNLFSMSWMLSWLIEKQDAHRDNNINLLPTCFRVLIV